MASISDSELQAIVRSAVQQTLAETNQVAPSNATPAANVGPMAIIPNVDLHKIIIAIGADHGGFALKESLKSYITELGYLVKDLGTFDKNPVDYPDFALPVALEVSQGKAWRGIVVDGAGIGSCIVANKVPGIRAALCYDQSSAMNSREHNDANLLTLGAGLIGDNLARQIVATWLATAFGGGRHVRRVEKIIAVEHQFMKSGV
jgi:ribose 5-phosphate isomerase B